jgi:hypothetical protein
MQGFRFFSMTGVSLQANASSYVYKQRHQSNRRYLLSLTTLCTELPLAVVTNLQKPPKLQRTPPDH